MYRLFCNSLIVISFFFTGCFTSSSKKSSTLDTDNEKERQTAISESDKSMEVMYTFLDTINRGNEFALSNDDFEKNGEQKVALVTSTKESEAQKRYRIQVFASNRIETIREKKKELELQIKEEVVIGYEAPYYKLYAGSFQKRQDAKVMLPKLKKMGYHDAWIVSINIASQD
jgi:hypothetical protein